MGLHDRAKIERCDLYPPNAWSTDSDSVADLVDYGPNAAYSDVVCHLEKKREGSAPSGYGRTDRDILDTTDRLHVKNTQDIGDGWAVKMTSGPYSGLWFMIQGEEQNLPWRAGDKVLLLKPSLKPPGVS